MNEPLLFPEETPDDRDDGEWLCCPKCGCIAELDDWEVGGRSIVFEDDSYCSGAYSLPRRVN